jgi:hypothetical protein
MSPWLIRTPWSRSAAVMSPGVTWSPGSSHGTPRRRGISRTTPRPAMPSAAMAMESSTAPAAVTALAGTPL